MTATLIISEGSLFLSSNRRFMTDRFHVFERALTYGCIFRRVHPEPAVEVARGALTVVCVTRDEGGKMRAAPIPPYIAERLEVAPAEAAGGG